MRRELFCFARTRTFWHKSYLLQDWNKFNKLPKRKNHFSFLLESFQQFLELARKIHLLGRFGGQKERVKKIGRTFIFIAIFALMEQNYWYFELKHIFTFALEVRYWLSDCVNSRPYSRHRLKKVTYFSPSLLSFFFPSFSCFSPLLVIVVELETVLNSFLLPVLNFWF